MTLNEQIQANRIIELERQVEEMTPLVMLLAIATDDEPLVGKIWTRFKADEIKSEQAFEEYAAVKRNLK